METRVSSVAVAGGKRRRGGGGEAAALAHRRMGREGRGGQGGRPGRRSGASRQPPLASSTPREGANAARVSSGTSFIPAR